ncbi:MAG: S1-like domain-containing RNA-binding protein [Campylobacterota bacterium]|nr:S1-like domain-containing RNA-binding protein [Campylobacterota bacterium]
MINKNIRIGELNTLKINRDTEPGLYLEALDEEVVLLPNAYVTDDMYIDDEIEVFIYRDSEDRLVATTQEPYGMKDEFIIANVVDTMAFGAFIDWGLPKDLFVPKNKQKTPFKVGEKRIVRIIEDEDTNRLIGVEKVTSYLTKDTKDLKENQEVRLLIFAKTPLGFKVIVDNKYEGLIYKNEIFTKLEVSNNIKGYIKQIRDDGKLDISLQPIGKDIAKDINGEKIIKLLKQNENHLPYNYKTDVDVVKKVFGISKKAYKRALTTLLELNKIKLNDEGISLI